MPGSSPNDRISFPLLTDLKASCIFALKYTYEAQDAQRFKDHYDGPRFAE